MLFSCKSLAPATKNQIIKTGTQPLRWAFAKEYIDRDITKGIILFSGDSRERQILTPEIAKILFQQIKWDNEKAKLANMLASVTGLRAGEIQALQIQDIGQDCLYIKRSYNMADGLKTTKNNSSRIVELPFPDIIQQLLQLAAKNPHRATPDSFVFYDDKSATRPVNNHLFLRGLRYALISTGMTEKSAKVYEFHSWRHFYTSYMKERIADKLLQSQTGHKTLSMLKRYSDHQLVGDREKIQAAQIEVFGDLVSNGN